MLKLYLCFCSFESCDVKASDAALSKTYDMLTDQSYGLEMAIAPKAMADMVESLAGAIFVDSGSELGPVFEVMFLFGYSITSKKNCMPCHCNRRCNARIWSLIC